MRMFRNRKAQAKTGFISHDNNKEETDTERSDTRHD